MSILEESKKARRNTGFLGGKKKYLFLLIIIFVGSWYYYQSSAKETEGRTQEVAQKEWTVKKDDLQISIESDGKVVAEDGVELSFSVSGDTLEVEQVYVKEGDTVKRGDKIASVTTQELEFNLQSAYASYDSAVASLNQKQATATEEEIQKSLASIEQAEINLDQAKINQNQTKLNGLQKIDNAKRVIETAETSLETAGKNLENAKNNLEIDEDSQDSEIVKKAYEDLYNSIKSINVSLQSLFYDADDILGIENEYTNDDFESYLSVKNSSALIDAKASFKQAQSANEALDAFVLSLDKNNHSEVDSARVKTEEALSKMEVNLYGIQVVLDATETGNNFSQSDLDTLKSKITAARSSITNHISTLTKNTQAISNAKNSLESNQISYEKALLDYEKAESALEDAKQDLETTEEEVAQDNANAEASVAAKEVSIKQTEISHAELIAPAREVDLASARAQVTSAAINVDKAKYNIEQATLTSPIDGEVALLNYKTGDIINRDDNLSMAEIINNDSLFIEVNIEEADINKIQVGQKAYATFDAVEDLELEGEISFISLTSQTNNSGIVTYLVRIVINNTKEGNIREGMTAFINFITAEATDVLVVPVDAVRNIEGKPSVILKSGEVQEVVTGFTDGDNVEVINGLEVGEVVVY